MESPYILLTSRLVDTAPHLLRACFARHAREVRATPYMCEFAAVLWTRLPYDEGAPPPSQAHAATQGGTLVPRRPFKYVRGGKLTVAYVCSVPAGHVTYDLTGSMLRFHTDPRLRVLWCVVALALYGRCSQLPYTAGTQPRATYVATAAPGCEWSGPGSDGYIL